MYPKLVKFEVSGFAGWKSTPVIDCTTQNFSQIGALTLLVGLQEGPDALPAAQPTTSKKLSSGMLA